MKTLIILFWVFIVSLGCQKEQKISQNADTGTDSITKGSIRNPAPANVIADSIIKNGIENLTYDTGKLPDGVKYSGKIVAGARWDDKNGENILIITETPVKGTPGDSRMKELFGYHYTITGGGIKLMWKINDFVKDCPVDLTLKYIDESLSITDLDNNGIAESTFLYRLSCKGDVSPDNMKLLMHENETKYAIRGNMKLTIKGEGTYGGEMKVDPAFNNAPKEFLDYARERWNKNNEETIGY